MLTFFWLIKKDNIKIISYESQAEGVSKLDKKHIFRFTKIILRPHIVIDDAKEIPKVEHTIDQLESWCCISNSTNAVVLIEPTIEVKEDKK